MKRIQEDGKDGFQNVVNPVKSRYGEKSSSSRNNTYIPFIPKFLFAFFDNLATNIIKWRQIVNKGENMEKEDLVFLEKEGDKDTNKSPNKHIERGSKYWRVTKTRRIESFDEAV